MELYSQFVAVGSNGWRDNTATIPANSFGPAGDTVIYFSKIRIIRAVLGIAFNVKVPVKNGKGIQKKLVATRLGFLSKHERKRVVASAQGVNA